MMSSLAAPWRTAYSVLAFLRGLANVCHGTCRQEVHDPDQPHVFVALFFTLNAIVFGFVCISSPFFPIVR